MFTGIISDIGTVLARDQHGDLRLRIATSYDVDAIDIGASIAWMIRSPIIAAVSIESTPTAITNSSPPRRAT